MIDIRELAGPCKLILWCDAFERRGWNWRNENNEHRIVSDADSCPEEEFVPCPAKGCRGKVRCQPPAAVKILGKKKVRKKRRKKKTSNGKAT